MITNALVALALAVCGVGWAILADTPIQKQAARVGLLLVPAFLIYVLARPGG